MALGRRANAICEKPLVITLWNNRCFKKNGK